LAGALIASLTSVIGKAVAQHTVVQDAGGGRKMELVYNAAGQVTEQRMLGPDGNLTEKTEFEHRPGFYQPQEVVTSYWPDGKVKTIVRTTYDANSNFLLELARVFDESGKQTGGHRLTHDPELNVYHCYEWNRATQNYKEVVCPAGEGGGGGEGPEEARQYSYDEVMRHLNTARKAAQQEQRVQSRRPMSADEVHPAVANKEVGLVLPAQIGSGDVFSGTIVANPERYNDVAGVKVFRFTVPFTASGTGSSLMDWEVVTLGKGPQRADGPVTFALGPGSSQLKLTLQQVGSPATAVSQVIDVGQFKSRPQAQRAFQAAPLCMKGQLCAVSGPLSGDASRTFVAIDNRPATIIAESRSMAYLTVPQGMNPGDHGMFLAEGAQVVAFPMVVGELLLEQGRNFSQGQTLALNVRLQGPDELPESEWRLGNFPVENLVQARKLVPEFALPRESHGVQERREAEEKREAREKDKPGAEPEKDATGQILVVIRNPAPEQVTLWGSGNGDLVFRLGRPSFARGDFSYDFVAEAKQAGTFAVKGCVIPFLAPVAGQEFTVKTGTAGVN
jgi:YD repeat-containing protein